MITKVLLAKAADLDNLNLPVIGSPKLDGIRCLIRDGLAVSRTFKAIPNNYIRNWLEANANEGFDGEIMLRNLTGPMRDVTSAVMSVEGEPDFIYSVFDWVFKWRDVNTPFRVRVENLDEWFKIMAEKKPEVMKHMGVVPQKWLDNREDVDTHHVAWVEQGFEGSMIRDPEGIYKQGRSTVPQGILLKIKNWADEEAEVIGVVEEFKNNNEATLDALGHTERSTHKENMVGKGTMGALHCRMLSDDTKFHVGSGFNAKERQDIWDAVTVQGENDFEPGAMQHDVIGAILKVKHQPDFSGRRKGQAPRFPIFLGFRNLEVD